ncbi:unnamed protein product [Peniophora sp. CBMAI 1063]|nr:unnamed protein product [Peniophora sp. CBMAI 1063]
MSYNVVILDSWRNRLLTAKLRELYSGKSSEERMQIQASRFVSICLRLARVDTLELAKRAYELLIKETNHVRNDVDPTISTVLQLIFDQAGPPEELTDWRILRDVVDTVVHQPEVTKIHEWFGDHQWWDYVAQVPEGDVDGVSVNVGPSRILAPSHLLQLTNKNGIANAPFMSLSRHKADDDPRVRSGGSVKESVTKAGSSTSPYPGHVPADLNFVAEERDGLGTDDNTGHHRTLESLPPSQVCPRKRPSRRRANSHRSSKAPNSPQVPASPSFHVAVDGAEHNNSNAEGDSVRPDGKFFSSVAVIASSDEGTDSTPTMPLQRPTVKAKPRSKSQAPSTITTRVRNPSTWYVRGIRFLPNRPAVHVLDLLEPGKYLDLFSLFQLPQMHGIREADLAEYTVPCKSCHRERLNCIFRPGKISIGGACLACYYKQVGCSAGNQKITLGDNVCFRHPSGFRGSTPELRVPELHVRASFLQSLVNDGHLKEWPNFIDNDGQINHKDFAKDPAFDVDESQSLYFQVSPFHASDEDYYSVHPRYHETNASSIKAEEFESILEDGTDLYTFDGAPPSVGAGREMTERGIGEGWGVQADADVEVDADAEVGVKEKAEAEAVDVDVDASVTLEEHAGRGAGVEAMPYLQTKDANRDRGRDVNLSIDQEQEWRQGAETRPTPVNHMWPSTDVHHVLLSIRDSVCRMHERIDRIEIALGTADTPRSDDSLER